MATTQSHLDLAIEHLEFASVEFWDAKRAAEMFGWPTQIVERLDLLARATNNLKKQMADWPADIGQEELVFGD